MNTKNTSNTDTIKINSRTITPQWTTLYTVEPTYFWDEATGTLGLDGDWGCHYIRTSQHLPLVDNRSLVVGNKVIRHLYLGEHFTGGSDAIMAMEMLARFPVTVSPDHPSLTTIDVPGKDGFKDIPVWKETGKLALEVFAWDQEGNRLYEFARDGKWGIIDGQGHPVVPLRYGVVWPADENNLFTVMRDEKMGLVDLQGNEVVPPLDGAIYSCDDGYEVTMDNGDTFLLDKHGNRIE